MAPETWVKKETTEEQPLPETQYEVKDTVVVRSVTKTDLNRQLENLDAQIVNIGKEKARVQADLDKIKELEAA